MTYDDWEIDAIRRALNNYRTLQARNGRLLTWKNVIENILSSTVTSYNFPETGEEPEFLEEALRRFGNGTSTLQPEKLIDLRLFLRHENLLPDEKFNDEQNELRGIFAAVSYLANDDHHVAKLFRSMGSTYINNVFDNGVIETTTLHLSIDPSKKFFRVEEEMRRRTQVDSARRHRKEDEDISREIRRGYGCASTLTNVLHAFLRGAAPNDRITYLQADVPLASSEIRSVHLMRSGAWPKSSDVSQDGDQTPSYNIRRFVSEGSGFPDASAKDLP
jgi:hypothetical protein